MLGVGLFNAGAFGLPDANIMILAPKDPTTGNAEQAARNLDYGMGINVFTNEVLCTFIFVSVILMVKGKHTAGERVGIGAAMVVCLTLLCVIAATNALGACFNPAVALSASLNSVFWLGNNEYLYHYLYAYTLGPAMGGLLAGCFHCLHAKAFEPDDRAKDFDASQKESFIDN